MEFVNLCDHPVSIQIDTEMITIPPSGKNLRVEWVPANTRYVEYRGKKVPIVKDGVVKNIRGLPERQEGVLYIASHSAAQYCNLVLQRDDIVCPATTRKDSPIYDGDDLIAVRKLRGGV